MVHANVAVGFYTFATVAKDYSAIVFLLDISTTCPIRREETKLGCNLTHNKITKSLTHIISIFQLQIFLKITYSQLKIFLMQIFVYVCI